MRHLILSLIFTLSCALSIHAQTMKDGIDYCKGGYYDDAIAVLEKCMDSPDTDKGMAYYYLGLAELGKKDVQKAQAAFSKSIENTNGSSVEPLLASGALALLNSDSKGAEGYFKKAEKQGKESPSVLREIARVYVMVDPVSYASQIDKYKDKCIKKAINQSKYMWAYCLIEGDITNDPYTAGGQYLAASEKNTEDVEGVMRASRVFEDVDLRYSGQALGMYMNSNANPSNVIKDLYEKLLVKYARFLIKDGNYSEALNIVNEALQIYPDSEELKKIKEEVSSKKE